MTVLANALSAADTVMNLGSALDVGNFPAPYTIGSEAILVTGGDNTKSPSIIRGQNGTASAAHAAGTSLTSGWGGGSGAIAATDGSTTVNPATTIQFPGGTLADLGSGTAGVGLVMTLKTFDLTPATPDFVSPGDLGTLLFSLPAGSLCLAQVMQTGDSDQGGLIQLSADDGTGNQDIGVFARTFGATSQSDWSIPSEVTITYPVSGGFAAPSGYQVWFEAVSGCNLYAEFLPTGTPPSTGHWRVFAIIATPAS